MIARSTTLFASAIAAALFGAALLMPSPSYSQRNANPFASFPGAWNGSGTITLSNGAREAIKCRATYATESGSGIKLEMRCASASYRFELQSSLTYSDGAVSGTWNETMNRAAGTISGSVSGNTISLRASGQTFTALMSISTNGSRQTISIQSPGSELNSVSISMSKG